ARYFATARKRNWSSCSASIGGDPKRVWKSRAPRTGAAWPSTRGKSASEKFFSTQASKFRTRRNAHEPLRLLQVPNRGARRALARRRAAHRGREVLSLRTTRVALAAGCPRAARRGTGLRPRQFPALAQDEKLFRRGRRGFERRAGGARPA